MIFRYSALALLFAFSTSGVFAQDEKDEKKEIKTVEDQTFCPIMIKKEVDGESEVVEYKGVKIRMCCETCVERFEANPEAYLLKEYIPQLNDMEIPERKIKQTFCPVYPDRVVSENDLTVEYEGKTIYLFNKAAFKKWNRKPEKYVDTKILPQLLEDEDEDSDDASGESEEKESKKSDGQDSSNNQG